MQMSLNFTHYDEFNTIDLRIAWLKIYQSIQLNEIYTCFGCIGELLERSFVGQSRLLNWATTNEIWKLSIMMVAIVVDINIRMWIVSNIKKSSSCWYA